MLDQRRRRCADVVHMLYKCFVSAGHGHTAPSLQPESIDAMNGYQPTCNAFTRHSNDIKIKNPSPLSGYISYKHVVKVLVCVIIVEQTDFLNIENSNNHQPLKMGETN